jgi:hypothetical protein
MHKRTTHFEFEKFLGAYLHHNNKDPSKQREGSNRDQGDFFGLGVELAACVRISSTSVVCCIFLL